jgi:hypothetical protein
VVLLRVGAALPGCVCGQREIQRPCMDGKSVTTAIGKLILKSGFDRARLQIAV